MTDEEIRALIAELPEVQNAVRAPRGYVVKGRPDARGAADAGTDLAALDAWVTARGGALRTGRAPSASGLGPGRRVAPPPSAPQRFYVLPPAALAE
ncbi:MAG TPA: hypothetical protein VF257_00245 [Solirubrobacteraceae bacterium]